MIAVFSFLLAVPPIIQSSQLIFTPENKQEIRPVIEYVKANQQPGDQLYVYFKGNNHFRYYAPRYGYSEDDYILGQIELPNKSNVPAETLEYYRQELAQFQGQNRVWFVFRADNSEEQVLSTPLNQMGQQLD